VLIKDASVSTNYPSLLKNSIVELYEEEKRRKILSNDLNSHTFVSKNGISHSSKLISLDFQQAVPFC
jgi:hypothetical protein